MTTVLALAVTLALMLFELRVSSRHERVLRGRGATAPADPVYSTMRWAYPGVFVVMAGEGFVTRPAAPGLALTGAGIFVAAKLLKWWAIRSLGERWTFKVLILPGLPLVQSGPYRWVRHPNYLAVIGEVVGFSFMAGARLTGIAGVLFFGELLRRRIRAEEQALGLGR